MGIPIILLLFFGALNLVLGVVWNVERQRITGVSSKKYKTLWIIGIAEIYASLLMILLLFYF